MIPTLRILLAAALLCIAPAAHAQLSVVQVAKPGVNCVFDASCTVTVNDHVAPLFGAGRLQSRTYVGQPGSPAAGMHVYEYRVDLTAAPGAPAVTSLTVDFGPVIASLDFDGAGGGDQVFVVTRGGLGSVAVRSATKSDRLVTFHFSEPVASGQTSYFFGLVSRFAPGDVRSSLATAGGETVNVTARGPTRGRAGIPPIVRIPPVAMAPEDCIRYNPANLAISDEGANGWLLADGGMRLLMLDNREDADRALALARRHTHQCFVGRNNSRPNRRQYIMQYWRGVSGTSTTIAGEDCLPYNRTNVDVFDRGALGWRMEDGSHAMQLFDTQAEANRGLMVARAMGQMCYIGRSNGRPDRLAYIVQYWK